MTTSRKHLPQSSSRTSSVAKRKSCDLTNPTESGGKVLTESVLWFLFNSHNVFYATFAYVNGIRQRMSLIYYTTKLPKKPWQKYIFLAQKSIFLFFALFPIKAGTWRGGKVPFQFKKNFLFSIICPFGNRALFLRLLDSATLNFFNVRRSICWS